jgi:predicted transcriptional regulator
MPVVWDPRVARRRAGALRRQILEALEEPGSASTVAARLGESRQKVAYHVRQLEQHGFVKLVREEQRRGCTERIVQRSARYLMASSEVLGKAGLDAKKMRDKFSGEYLAALASRMAREVADAHVAADRAGKRLATLSTEVDVRLRSPAELAAFAGELVDAVARIAARYHHDKHPDGRTYRVVLGSYPVKGRTA